MTVDNAAGGPATCLAIADNGASINSDEVLGWAAGLTRAPESTAESSDDCGSEVCMVSAHSFQDDSTDDESQTDAGGDEWEML